MFESIDAGPAVSQAWTKIDGEWVWQKRIFALQMIQIYILMLANQTKPNSNDPDIYILLLANQTKPNQTKPNQTKPNQTQMTQISTYILLLANQTKPNLKLPSQME